MRLTEFHRHCVFYKWKACDHPASSESVGSIFPVAFAHCVSASHFDDSNNISCFFIIMVFVMVICDW